MVATYRGGSPRGHNSGGTRLRRRRRCETVCATSRRRSCQPFLAPQFHRNRTADDVVGGCRRCMALRTRLLLLLSTCGSVLVRLNKLAQGNCLPALAASCGPWGGTSAEPGWHTSWVVSERRCSSERKPWLRNSPFGGVLKASGSWRHDLVSDYGREELGSLHS